jgi:hypothetical protein
MNEVVQAERFGDHQSMPWWAAQKSEVGGGAGHGPLPRLGGAVSGAERAGEMPGQAELEAFGVDGVDPLSPPVPFEDVPLEDDEPSPELFSDDPESEDPGVDFSGVEFSESDVPVVDVDFSVLRSLAADPWSFL